MNQGPGAPPQKTVALFTRPPYYLTVGTETKPAPLRGATVTEGETLAAVQARLKARTKLGWKPATKGSALKRFGQNGSRCPKGVGR